MKQKILASEIAGLADFAGAAARHAVEMKAWRAHMRRVREDEKNEVPIEERHVAYPPPRAHPVVERAVDENDEANFEIVEDGPTEEEKLASRKLLLLQEVSRLEQKAIDAVVPMGKRRLFNIRENDINIADAQRRGNVIEQNRGLMKKISGQLLTNEEIEAQVAAARLPEDAKHLADQADRRARIDAIQRAAAQAHHDIEDLTAETIGSWKLPTF